MKARGNEKDKKGAGSRSNPIVFVAQSAGRQSSGTWASDLILNRPWRDLFSVYTDRSHLQYDSFLHSFDLLFLIDNSSV
jgi:hypothetical protein